MNPRWSAGDLPKDETSRHREPMILMAEDDPDDRRLAREAFDEAATGRRLAFVEDGEQTLAYLRRQDVFADTERYPFPDLLLLDLNMPRMTGHQVLEAIRADPALRSLPVVAFTTSDAIEDVNSAYAGGINSYLVKPSRFASLVEMMRGLDHYWLELSELPSR